MSIAQTYPEVILGNYGAPKFVAASGSGSYLTDDAGKRYLDMLGGIAVNCLGHAHPAWVAAVSEQAGKLAHVSNFFATEPQVRLASRLLKLAEAPKGSKVFFTNSGTEANEAAIKLARLHNPGGRIVALGQSFHGRSTGALAITHKVKYRDPFTPLLPGVDFIEANDIEQLEMLFAPPMIAKYGAVSALFIECIQGEAGVQPLSAQYIARARHLTRENNCLLIVDEVQTGIGRTGQWFAHRNELVVGGAVVEPDAITLAKSLGGGFPIGAIIICGSANAEHFAPGTHGSTFGGNPLACAAANAVIDQIEIDDLLANNRAMSTEFARSIIGASNAHIREVRGVGLLLAVELDGDYADKVVDAALALNPLGLIVNNVAPNAIRLAPAYNIAAAEVRLTVDLLVKAIEAAHA